MTAAAEALRFQIGARTIFSVPRRLRRVALSLEEALAAGSPTVSPLTALEEGVRITSVPERLAGEFGWAGWIVYVRQRYVRHYADLTIGHVAWLAGLSANARSALRRKQKKLAQHPNGVAISGFRTVAELAEFHALARPLAALTYQERLLGSGLPDTPDFLARQAALAAEDRVRAWLMTLGGRPIAYLWCSAEGDALCYDYVGHDPALAELSPGTVLHAAAFEDLFAEGRFRLFDFSEGEGQHKRQFATGGVPCVDLLLLRPTLANRALVAALGSFDRAVAVAKRMATGPALAGLARRVRRAA